VKQRIHQAIFNDDEKLQWPVEEPSKAVTRRGSVQSWLSEAGTAKIHPKHPKSIAEVRFPLQNEGGRHLKRIACKTRRQRYRCGSDMCRRRRMRRGCARQSRTICFRRFRQGAMWVPAWYRFGSGLNGSRTQERQWSPDLMAIRNQAPDDSREEVISLNSVRTQIAAIWIAGVCLIYLLVIMQSVFGRLEDKVQDAWEPTLSPRFVQSCEDVCDGNHLQDVTMALHGRH